MLTSLAYELSILSKAVAHKNLSAAAVHVGLSQPQLSRLVAKIETELNIILLDRTARRKSGWTALAHELSIAYTQGIHRLQNEILALAQEREVTSLRIGSLEGLSGIALKFVKSCFERMKMHSIHLDILEFQELDSEFLSGRLDLIFTVRPPSKQKFSKFLEVGYQQEEKISTDKDTLVLSPFEAIGYDKKTIESTKRVLVSNSLIIRSDWLNKYGGQGVLPIDAKTGRGRGAYSVYLIGSDLLSPRLWNQIRTDFL